MNHLEDQRGVALILELLLVAVVLAVAGVGVYTAMHHKTALITQAKTTPTPASSASLTPAPTAQAKANYFTISQWGVRASYDGSDSFTYTITTDKWGSLATVTSASLAAKYTGCKTYGGGQIKRLLPSAIASQALATDSTLTIEQYAAKNPALVRVGGYYYMFQHDQAVCQDNGSVDEQNQSNNTIQGLVAKLELVN